MTRTCLHFVTVIRNDCTVILTAALGGNWNVVEERFQKIGTIEDEIYRSEICV